jgi:hypothetical protein
MTRPRLLSVLDGRIRQTAEQIVTLTRLKKELERRRRELARRPPADHGRGYCSCFSGGVALIPPAAIRRKRHAPGPRRAREIEPGNCEASRVVSYVGFMGMLIALIAGAWVFGFAWAWIYNRLGADSKLGTVEGGTADKIRPKSAHLGRPLEVRGGRSNRAARG